MSTLTDLAWRAYAVRVLSGQPATPLVRVQMQLGARSSEILLKLEGRSVVGSGKGRTARSLLLGLIRDGRLRVGSHIVESSSGNLAVALAMYAAELGVHFTAVVDPKTTIEIRALLAQTAAGVEMVDEQGIDGSYLAARRRRVRELVSALPDAVCTDQYYNADNPLAHYRETAPELLSQCLSPPDVVFVAVSTGGTVSGLARRMAELSPTTLVVAVDAIGSAATGGNAGPRLLTGIGSSQAIGFPLPDNVAVARVGDREAFAHARRLRGDTGVGIGGSAGATLAACARFLAAAPGDVTAVCLCADGADRYTASIYSDSWLAAHDVRTADTDLLPATGYQAVSDVDSGSSRY